MVTFQNIGTGGIIRTTTERARPIEDRESVTKIEADEKKQNGHDVVLIAFSKFGE